ncbi:MAG TPA: phosphonate ABC transporter, permease protein PhnE [bacterium]|jgi:phosphonate ABC transporter permease subunit PhnE
MAGLDEILRKYPELKKPRPDYWIIPSIIVVLAIIMWSSVDTELVDVERGAEGNVAIDTLHPRWDAAMNIIFGIHRQAYEEINGEKVRLTRTVDGEEVPVTRRTGGLIRPDFGPDTMKVLLPDMLETIEIALLGTLMAVILAFPLSFLAARNIVGTSPLAQTVYGATRFVFNFLSAIPALIVALIFTVIVGVGPAAGVLALGFHSIGMLGRLFAEALENVDKRPIEGVQSTGANQVETVAYAVVPQIGPLLVAYSIYRWDINVRMSMILGFVGAGGIGVFLQQKINIFSYSQVSTSFILILVTVTLIDLGSSWIQRRLI